MSAIVSLRSSLFPCRTVGRGHPGRLPALLGRPVHPAALVSCTQHRDSGVLFSSLRERDTRLVRLPTSAYVALSRKGGRAARLLSFPPPALANLSASPHRRRCPGLYSSAPVLWSAAVLHFRPEAASAPQPPPQPKPQPPAAFPPAAPRAFSGAEAGPAGASAAKAGGAGASEYPPEAFLFGNLLEVAAVGLRGSAQLGARVFGDNFQHLALTQRAASDSR